MSFEGERLPGQLLLMSAILDLSQETIALVASALLDVEWSNHGHGTRTCQGCHHSWTFTRQHTPGCRVDAALTALGYPDEASRREGLRKIREADQVKRYGRVVVT